MNDADLRSLERLCSKDDLSDSNVASLVVLGLRAATEIRRLRSSYAAIDNELSGVVVTCSNITGQPCVDRIRSLRAEAVNTEARIVERIAEWLDTLGAVGRGFAADVREGRWRP